jgi:hypothetical protein
LPRTTSDDNGTELSGFLLRRNDGRYQHKRPGCSIIWVAQINKKDYESPIDLGIRIADCGLEKKKHN